MASLLELKKQLVSETAAVKVRKESGLAWKEQQAKCSALSLEILALERAQKRSASLMAAVVKASK